MDRAASDACFRLKSTAPACRTRTSGYDACAVYAGIETGALQHAKSRQPRTAVHTVTAMLKTTQNELVEPLVPRIAATPVALARTLQNGDLFGRERVAARLMQTGQNVVDTSILVGLLGNPILLHRPRLMFD